MGLKEVQEYIAKLKKAEKLKEIREQVILFLCVLYSIATDVDEAKQCLWYFKIKCVVNFLFYRGLCFGFGKFSFELLISLTSVWIVSEHRIFCDF